MKIEPASLPGRLLQVGREPWKIKRLMKELTGPCVREVGGVGKIAT